jgi:hypothetical protein
MIEIFNSSSSYSSCSSSSSSSSSSKQKVDLCLKNFKFDQPTQQPKSNTFKYVTTNQFSMLENIIGNVSNVGSGSGSGSGVEEYSGSDSGSGSGEVNKSGSNSGSVSGGEEDFGTVPVSVNEENYDGQVRVMY